MSKVDVSVLLEQTADPEAPGLRKALAGRGLAIDHVSKLANTVYGSVEEAAIAGLQGAAGVEAVSRAESYDLPPLSSKRPQ